ncbi:hypothetical protein [Metabacillus iocasae]|uniref:Uncharacterized protein n=1 Tax=Priestia iocasae TaxID=2291674 RepID=A0ABS2QSY8_9BACI|nr:hypothetical protein [Metabacillus iocasae]MBM7702585.1 hypothetical protein [Metabacillus iocasae]
MKKEEKTELELLLEQDQSNLTELGMETLERLKQEGMEDERKE